MTHKKQGRSLSDSGYEIQKMCGWKVYSRTSTFGAEVHKPNIRIKRWDNKTLLLLTDLLTKSNRSEIQTYKVEERTFGTPCTLIK